MDNEEFFKQLHADIADKYQVPPRFIQILRRRMLGQGYTYPKFVEWAKKYIKNREWDPRAKNKVLFMNELIRFAESLVIEQWQDVLQITKFDKAKQ